MQVLKSHILLCIVGNLIGTDTQITSLFFISDVVHKVIVYEGKDQRFMALDVATNSIKTVMLTDRFVNVVEIL